MLILTRHDLESLLTIGDTIGAVVRLCPAFCWRCCDAATCAHASRCTRECTSRCQFSSTAIRVHCRSKRSRFIRKIQPAMGCRWCKGWCCSTIPSMGKLLAMMDAEHLTAMRTGAASGVATKHLARPDASTVLLFGAGAPDPANSPQSVPCARFGKPLSPSSGKDGEFCERMSQELRIEVKSTRDAQLAIRNADIICTATTSPTPLFDGEWLRPGTHINGVGSYTAK